MTAEVTRPAAVRIVDIYPPGLRGFRSTIELLMRGVHEPAQSVSVKPLRWLLLCSRPARVPHASGIAHRVPGDQNSRLTS